ncbi:hypothetical protein VP1G_10846 [Cytospora mali]|uniref:Uncharacterized protein n=1 Tax=Cytospora mali TaxID=578113 RepID=A0A194UWV6_CYTMA|nr:hypothetical protein VP1G_10846 [Valsa mali var. pyri (nom. inval.)]
MPVRLASARVLPAVEEREQVLALAMIRLDAGVRGLKVAALQQVCLLLEGVGDDEEVLRHDGEFVQDKGVVIAYGADDAGRGGRQDGDLGRVEVDVAVGLCSVESGPHQLWELGRGFETIG